MDQKHPITVFIVRPRLHPNPAQIHLRARSLQYLRGTATRNARPVRETGRGRCPKFIEHRESPRFMASETDSLVDRAEVSDTVTRLFINTDERNWDGVTDCFASKVLFDMSSLSGSKPSRVSPKKIVDQWESGLKGLTAIHHQIGNMFVSVEGREASAFCYATATHYYPNPTGNDTRTFVGTYD